MNVAELTEEEFHAELEKGYADMTAGKIKSAKKVFGNEGNYENKRH